MNPPGALRQAISGPHNWPLLLARTILTVGVLAALVQFVSPEALLDAMGEAPAPLWIGVLAGLFVGHLLAAMKWRIFLAASGTVCTPTEALRAHGAGLFANLCLPSLVGGDVIRAGMLARRRAIAALTVGSVADRIVDTSALVLLALLGAALAPNLLPDTTGLTLGVIGSLVVAAGVGGPLAMRTVPLQRLPEKVRVPIEGLREASDALISRPVASLSGFALSVGIQSSFVMLNAMLGSAIGIQVPLAVWFLCWPLAKLIALAPISLGGLGVREAALATLLAGFGVQSAAAVGQSLLWQAALIVLGLIAGALSFGTGRFIQRGDDAVDPGGTT